MFGVSGTRGCIGSRPPGAKSLLPCPDNVVGINTSQCKACADLAQLLPCHLCTGERCANPVRREHCVQPKNHAVYIASFGRGMLKVGVARWDRRVERISEQGARIALVVARDDGQSVRRVESAIKRCGIKDRYSSSEKLVAYAKKATEKEMLAEIQQTLEEMHRRVEGAWLDETEQITTSVGHLDSHSDLFDLYDGAALRGTVKQLFGTMLIITADNGSTVVLDGHDLTGWTLRDLEDHEMSSGQLTLELAGL